ncbi:MAG: TIGR03364 family FAD-dependent oxidoreductase [Dinghuibacter sp.]|nr:TIGR03364 family FAD-dependent oxidoreductase [Dinghuibacter sp.]
MSKKAVVIGAGIAGLAMARALAKKKYAVTVVDRDGVATGASIRNFGMVWPIGQPDGFLYETALQSRDAWKEISNTGACWSEAAGSMHLAYAPDEWQVLQELAAVFTPNRPVRLLTPGAVALRSPFVVQHGLLGALYSEDELIVNPRQAIRAIPAYLAEQYGVTFKWRCAATEVNGNRVVTGNGESLDADLVIICSGADLEALFPSEYNQIPVTKCQLQMMRLRAPVMEKRMGPALCGALSLAHYNSFKQAPSLPALRNRFNTEMQEYIASGIHVMVAQNEAGELTVGDSHEYGLHPEPFNQQNINELILNYLARFAGFPGYSVAETWTGVYTKLTNGEPWVFLSPQPGVYLFNGLGGAGMTLSFGAAEKELFKI